MAEYTTLKQVKIRLKQFHIDSESSEVVFDHLEENPLLEQLISQAEADIRAKRIYPKSYTCMTDRKPVKTSWQAIQRMECRENGETVRICLLAYFHLQMYCN